MSALQSDSAVNFINSLARRIADRALLPNAKDKKSTPPSKKLIAKSLLQITDSQLKNTIGSNIPYFEKLLDLTIAHYISEASVDSTESSSRSKKNYLCLNASQFHFKDILALSKTTSQATIDALILSILHTRGCSPQQVASVLISVAELPLAATSRFVEMVHTRLALCSHEWCDTSLAWNSSTFLLAFATVHACRSSLSYSSDPCWSMVTTVFQDDSCFTFVGHVSYWMLTLAAKGISFSAENISILNSKLLVLLTTARKYSDQVVADEDDPTAPISCLLTLLWLQSVPDSSEKKLIHREIYTFMRQWEGGNKLHSLWGVLATACGMDVEIDSELIDSGASLSSGRYFKFADWFIRQENLVSGAMRSVEVSVSGLRNSGHEGDSKDMDDDDNDDDIEIVLDGKANMASGSGDEEIEEEVDEDEGRVVFLDETSTTNNATSSSSSGMDMDDDEQLPVTFFLDKQGSMLLDDSVTSESSQILADLGDVGEKSAKKSKKRKSLAVIEEDADTENHQSSEKLASKTRKGKGESKKTSTQVLEEEDVVTSVADTKQDRPSRSTRSTRSSSQ